MVERLWEMIPFDPQELVKRAEKAGASEAEVVVEAWRESGAEARRGKPGRAAVTRGVRLGVRVALGKRVGSAGGEVSTREDALALVEAALRLARSSPEDPSWPGFNPRVAPAGVGVEVYHGPTAEAGIGDLVRLLGEQLGLVGEHGATAAEMGVGVEESLLVVANSYGGPVSGAETSAWYYLEVKRSGEGGEATFTDYYHSTVLDPARVEMVTREALHHVANAVRARKVEGFRGVLVLRQKEASSLLSTLIVPAISAQNIQQNRSPLAGRIGEQVLSGRITVLDDPFIPYAVGSAEFDDEGHPTTRKPVFERGVFQGALYDHYHAAREGRESTGNGFRRTPWSAPSPGPTNLVVQVEGARDSLESLIAEVDRGVLLVSSIGSWLSNPASGQINMTVSLGYLIERGELREPVKGLVVGGNIYEGLGDSLLGASGERECHGSVCTPLLALGGASFA